MIGKGANEIRPATLAEVQKILEARSGTAGEFGFEQQKSLDFARRFAHLKQNDAKEMLEELLKLEIKPEVAVKVVDLLPKNKSQLLLILSKDKADVGDKVVSKVEAIVAEYSKKAKKFEPKKEEAPVAAAEAPAEAKAMAVPPEPAEPSEPDDKGDKKGKKKE
jgi:DNA-directed RNA polymerase subunit F